MLIIENFSTTQVTVFDRSQMRLVLITNVKIPQKRGKLFFKQIFMLCGDSRMPQMTEMLQPGAIIAVPFFRHESLNITWHNHFMPFQWFPLKFTTFSSRQVKKKTGKLKRRGTTNESGFCSLTIEMQIFGNGCNCRIFWKLKNFACVASIGWFAKFSIEIVTASNLRWICSRQY